MYHPPQFKKPLPKKVKISGVDQDTEPIKHRFYTIPQGGVPSEGVVFVPASNIPPVTIPTSSSNKRKHSEDMVNEEKEAVARPQTTTVTTSAPIGTLRCTTYRSSRTRTAEESQALIRLANNAQRVQEAHEVLIAIFHKCHTS